MTFDQAIATQPEWIFYWVNFLGTVMFAAPVVMLIYRVSRPVGLAILIINIIAVAAMLTLYNQIGFVRLLGIVHVVIWVPLLLWLWPRRDVDWPMPPRLALLVFMAAIAVSLAFDIVDVARWVLGERDSMLPTQG